MGTIVHRKCFWSDAREARLGDLVETCGRECRMGPPGSNVHVLRARPFLLCSLDVPFPRGLGAARRPRSRGASGACRCFVELSVAWSLFRPPMFRDSAKHRAFACLPPLGGCGGCLSAPPSTPPCVESGKRTPHQGTCAIAVRSRWI